MVPWIARFEVVQNTLEVSWKIVVGKSPLGVQDGGSRRGTDIWSI